MTQEHEDSYIRSVPPSMPSGFKALQLEGMLILDFFTAFPNEAKQVFSSVAVQKEMAENIVHALTKFIEYEQEEGGEAN